MSMTAQAFAHVVSKDQLLRLLSISDEFELLHQLKAGKFSTLVHMMYGFKKDRAATWPLIERAIKRNKLALAVDLLLAANSNDHREFDRLCKDSGIHVPTQQELDDQYRQFGYGPPSLGLKLG